MIDQRFVILGALLSLSGSVRYARETLAGRARPNRVTWLLWALAPLIAFAAELSAGVGLPAVLSLSVGLGPAIVFVASLIAGRRSGGAPAWTITRLDLACGALSLLALGLWAASGSGVLAICLSIAADALAAVPTLVKAVRAPETEHPTVFRNSALNGVITLLTIDDWTFQSFGFPVYIVLLGGSLYTLVRIRPRLIRPRLTD